MGAGATLYDRLGVGADADGATLRAAYRRLARQLHPDVGGPGEGGLDMVQVNEAWRVLSDPHRRRAYDATLRWPPGAGPGATNPATRSSPTRAPSADGGPGPDRRPGPDGRATDAAPGGPSAARSDRPVPGWATVGARREAWLAGLRLQIRRLGTQAARSAAQTLVIRHRGMARQPYEVLVGPIVDHLLEDTAERIRRARQAGAAPLDLAIGAALVGLRAYADELIGANGRAGRSGRAAGTVGGAGTLGGAERFRTAEMIDRMWDTMAHEVPHELAVALGGNPRAARHLRP